MRMSWQALAAAGLLLVAGGANAGLMAYESNGVELVYDDVQDLTWMRDGNLFKTQYDADDGVVADIIAAVPTITGARGTHTVVTGDFNTFYGSMTWYGAMAWVEWLGSIGYAGANDWRLPAIIDTDAPGCDFAYVGTDCGYNVDTATGELAHLWYDTLDNIAECDTSGKCPQPGWGLTNTGPFGSSLQYAYWPGTEHQGFAWFFRADKGFQNMLPKGGFMHGWAVRPGQIGASEAPLPGTAVLLALGFGALSLSRRARRRPC